MSVTFFLTSIRDRLRGLLADPRHLSILSALPVAVCAYLGALGLEGPSGQGSVFDYISYPLIAALFVALEALLLTRRLSTTAVVMTVIVAVYSQFVGKLTYLLYFNPHPALIQAELTETFFWLPALFVLSAFVPGLKRGRVVVGAFFALLAAISVGYAVPNGLAGQYLGVVYALFELLLANATLLVLTFNFIGFKENLARTSARAETMERLAYHDPLTELPNRLALERRLAAQIAGCRTGCQVAVAFIDLDDFKGVNDLHGHAVSDRS